MTLGKHALGDRARKLDQGVLITRFELPYNVWWYAFMLFMTYDHCIDSKNHMLEIHDAFLKRWM